MMENTELGAWLEAAVRAGGGSELTSVGEAIDRYVFDGAIFPSALFEQVLSVIRGAEFRRLRESVSIIKVFEYNLGLLTEAQKQQLFTALSESIPELADTVSAFLAVELLAELWRDQRSLEALLHLTKGASENTLALAVHGLDWLAKKTEQTDTRTRCLDELRRLSKHPSRLVRAEAITALNRRMA